jgi:hypothetical protein
MFLNITIFILLLGVLDGYAIFRGQQTKKDKSRNSAKREKKVTVAD